VVKGREFCLYTFKFIGVSNRNRVPSNRSMFDVTSDQNKIQHQKTVTEKENFNDYVRITVPVLRTAMLMDVVTILSTETI
jgi:hypothetical protein